MYPSLEGVDALTVAAAIEIVALLHRYDGLLAVEDLTAVREEYGSERVYQATRYLESRATVRIYYCGQQEMLQLLPKVLV